MSNLSNSKTLRLLNALSAIERKQFDKWLSSPWCNTSNQLQTLHQILVKHGIPLNECNLTKEQLFKKLYKSDTFVKGKFNNITSLYNKQLEKFLIHHRLEQQTALQDELLKDELADRQLQGDWKDQMTKIKKSLAQLPVHSSETALRQMNYFKELYDQPGLKDKYKKDNPWILEMDHHLDTFYALHKYRIAYEYVMRNNILNDALTNSINLAYLDELRKRLAIPPLELYHHRIQTGTTINWDSYLAFKKSYLALFDQLNQADQKVFLIYCINDAVQLSAKDDQQGRANEALLYWFQYGLDTSLLLNNNKLSGASFNNMIIAASLAKDVSLLEKWINQCKPLLEYTIRNDALHWAECKLYYHTNQIEKCLLRLQQYNFDHRIYSIQAKVLELKAAFDRFIQIPDTSTNLLRLSQNFEKFMRRDSLYTEGRSRPYVRFTSFVERLCQLMIAPNKALPDFQKIAAELEEEPRIVGRIWLRHKIAGQIKDFPIKK